jgi:Calcineurin-like phosphoesterase
MKLPAEVRARPLIVSLLLLCLLVGVKQTVARENPEGAAQDPIKLSFAFMGCNRIQHSDWKKIKDDDPSSANLPQLQRSFEDISKLVPQPSYLFFTGDLVVNLEDDDGKVLMHQLKEWTKRFHASPLAGKVTLVPLPGNHEMLKKIHADKDDEDKIEVPNPAIDGRWLEWLQESGFDAFAKAANGPTNAAPNTDKLADDQSKMTYSFDLEDVHFVMINTDSLTTDIDQDTGAPHIGWIPYHWIEDDVRAAQKNPSQADNGPSPGGREGHPEHEEAPARRPAPGVIPGQ